jgi:hypothetical protein
MKEGAALRAKWGGRPCAHPDFYREVAGLGQKTGDYVCTECGALFSSEEKRAIEVARKVS